MKLLFIDTETTGLCNADLPADHPSQPRMVQLAGILCEGEVVISRVDFLIRPDGFDIPADATAIHGLTTEECVAYGVPLALALGWFNSMLDLEPLVVGHNIRFDLKVLRGELRRAGLPDRYADTKRFCTMEKSARYLPHGKWHSLEMCVRKILGFEPSGLHQATIDAEWCRKLYLWLMQKEAVPASS